MNDIKNLNFSPKDFFLPIKDVVKMTSLSASTLKTLIDKGEFPDPYRITESRKAWKYSEVMKWIESKKN